MSKVLWLTNRHGIGAVTKTVILTALRGKGVQSSDITFFSLHHKVPNLAVLDKKRMPFSHNAEAARFALAQFIGQIPPRLIVVNDEPTLRILVDKPYSLAQVRGSVYEFMGIPVLVLDKFENLWSDTWKSNADETEPNSKRTFGKAGKWVFNLDLEKLARFALGRRKNEPRFDFTICRTVDEVRGHCEKAKRATLLATDTETRSGYITVVSFTYDFEGRLYTFCIPFSDPWADDGSGSYWRTFTEERDVRLLIKDLLESPVPKTVQNLMYDCAYFVNEGMVPINVLYDPSIMVWARWCEAPKKLHFIASYFLDDYRYWKDERKGMAEDNEGRTRDDLLRYWNYNGRDSHYLWLCTKELAAELVRTPWAMANYNSAVLLSVGPCFAASLRGMKHSKQRHAHIMKQKEADALKGQADIRKMTQEPDFNLRSTYDVAWFLYDFLGAQPTRIQRKKDDDDNPKRGRRKKYGPRSTDEKVLKLIKEQRNPLVNNFIDRLLRAKKPASDISKYGNYDELTMNGRFVSWMNPTGTTTGRFNSGNNQFWRGTNGQNIQVPMREMFVADEGYCYVSLDYSASDDRFIAYECEDPDKIATVEDKSRDIHCKHCSIFFQLDYEKVWAGWKAEEGWVVDEPRGVRQITKKVTHGRNYREGPETMYNLMGREAVVAAARALGHAAPERYNDAQLIAVCAFMIDRYDHPIKGMYKRMRPWQGEIVTDAVKRGNIATFAHGFTRQFFGNLADDHAAQRELSACYGQSATAGNINRALNSIYYSGLDDGRTCLFLFQGHDNLLFLIHKDHIHRLVPQIKEIMEAPTTIHGREMRVPTDPKIGLTWSKYMLSYKPDLTWEQIVAYEKEKFGDKYAKMPTLPADEKGINSLNFDDLDALLDKSLLGSDIDDDDEEFQGSAGDFDETGGVPEHVAAQ